MFWRATGTVPEPVEPQPLSFGERAILTATECYADTELLVSAINSAMSRIDRGIYDHLHRPEPPKGQKPVDTLLDMTNGLHAALTEVRERLEKGLRELDVRRGVDGVQT